MGTKIGRNQPCPCGSGKKYKLCCLRGMSNQREGAPLSGRFRFEPGSYGAPGEFLPSLACLEQWQPNEWRYHFVLVRLDVKCEEEAEAVSQAAEDLEHAFKQAGASAGPVLAANLRTLGYVRVDGFNVVKQDAGPVVEQAAASDSVGRGDR